MARTKKPRKEGPAKPAPDQGARLEEFLDDWGRLVVPLGAAAILAALRLLGVLDDVSLGYAIGLVVLVIAMAAYGLLIWRNEFPRWVHLGSIAAGLLFLIGAVTPYTTEIYPGDHEFRQVVSRTTPDVALDSLPSGQYRVEVFAKSFADAGPMRGGEGQYRITVAGKDLSGRFTDTMRTTRGRRGMSGQVEDRHFLDVHTMRLPSNAKALHVGRIDQNIGPDLQVSLYRTYLAPWLVGVLLVAVGLWSMFLDGVYQDQTWRWRLTPWFGVGAFFLWVFSASYDPSKMPGSAIWSAVFGGLGGFLVGWLLSLLARRVLGRLRTRF
ncbi:MAG TPA: hypothetical protein PK313_07030 [Myxococcota bacterium]|nr:hypothetical protein [Myxococcota bacterium]